MSKEEVIQILVDRDGIDREEARMLINETMDEIIQNPMEAISISSPYSLIGALILVLVVVAIGGVISRRNSNFN